MSEPLTLRAGLAAIDAAVTAAGAAPGETDFEAALLAAGVPAEDLTVFTAAYESRDPDVLAILGGSPMTASDRARALYQYLADYPMGGIDADRLLLSDAVAWATVSLPDVPLDLPGRWMPYTPHGWLFHAAGLTPEEALDMPKGTEQSLRALAALRDSPAPALPAGVRLVWPPSGSRPSRSLHPER